MGLQPCQTGEGEADWWWRAASWFRPAVQRFAGVDWPPVWDGELCLWPDETRPLSTYLWISRSRDSLSPNLPSRSRPSALGVEKKVNIFKSSIHRLAVVYRLLALNFCPFTLTPPPTKNAEWHDATGSSLLRKESRSDCRALCLSLTLIWTELHHTTHLPAVHFWRLTFRIESGSWSQNARREP